MRLNSYQKLRVPNFTVQILVKILQDAELDWRAALTVAELDPKIVSNPGGSIPAKKELAFQLQFVKLTEGRSDLWIEVARSNTLGAFGIRGLTLISAPNLQMLVEATTYTDLAPQLVDMSALRTRDDVVQGIEFSYPDAPEELIPFSVYRDLYAVARNFSWLYGSQFPFTSVEVPLNEVSDEVTAALGCEVFFGADTLRVWWDPEISLEALPYGNVFQHQAWLREDTRLVDALRSSEDWPDIVAKLIKSSPERNRKLANVAVALRVSTRTLQRKLGETGHDFAQIRDEVLTDLAHDLLSNTDFSVSRISRSLGYSDPASFTIAFKRWKGVPPTAFRQASQYQSNSLPPEPGSHAE